jgi:hypothetical protein
LTASTVSVPLSTTLNLVNDRRDQALVYILSVAPPVPPEEPDLARARASQDEEAGPTFDTAMPNVGPQLDDELQAIEGTKSDATDLTAA